ncbi:MAG: helix-turn-helix domain-containing protein [Atopobiaceae bacterium]|nr:helix-turn-helix domain-containing protein [Atopobiaceae bacterium]
MRAYAVEHPGESNRKVAAALGMSRNTVNKWLKPGWREEWDEEHRPLITGHVITVRRGR